MIFKALPFVLYIKHLKEMSAKTIIESGKAILGIEFGSTRIKAVLFDTDNNPIAQGSFEWENQLVDGLWTYSIDTIWKGLHAAVHLKMA